MVVFDDLRDDDTQKNLTSAWDQLESATVDATSAIPIVKNTFENTIAQFVWDVADGPSAKMPRFI